MAGEQTEYDVLNAIYEALPDVGDGSMIVVDLYPPSDTLPRPEMYFKVNDKCWRIIAVRHPHEGEPE